MIMRLGGKIVRPKMFPLRSARGSILMEARNSPPLPIPPTPGPRRQKKGPIWMGLNFLAGRLLKKFFFFPFQTSIPLSKRLSSSIKSVIGSKPNVSTLTSGNLRSGHLNMGGDEDLEMTDRATKADKSVADDGSRQDSPKNERMERIAKSIDGISRFLFPFAFVCYNIFYWAYY